MLTNFKCDKGTYSLKLSLDHNSPIKRKLNVTIEPGTRKFGEPDMTGTKVLRAAFRADVSSGGNGGGRAVSLCMFSGNRVDSAPDGNWGDEADFGKLCPHTSLSRPRCLKFL
jgi:hypothetical protein